MPAPVASFVSRRLIALTVLLVLAGGTHPVWAQDEAPAPDTGTSGLLFDALAALDAALFDALFVTCDPDLARGYLADDLEFYHDKEGVQMGEEALQSLRALAEGCPRSHGVTRDVVPGSLFVSPIHDYGAVQTGRHRFTEPGGTTVARFVHVWRETPEGWQVARVVSYDH